MCLVRFITRLNILEDYLNSRLYTYARIDGSIKGEQRQAALDRFTKPGSDVFIMVRQQAKTAGPL